MGEIEKRADAFADDNITVLPIVMNTRDQIVRDMKLNSVRTPFLLDDGTVSKAYGTLGKGMHAGLPGHSFVLIDTEGQQRWYGEYPSMWLDPDDLLTEVRSRLDTYGVAWSRVTFARDLLQNFFDAAPDFRDVAIDVRPEAGTVEIEPTAAGEAA